MRTKVLDGDYRCEPQTDRFCVRCQKDIKPDSPARAVHIVEGGSLWRELGGKVEKPTALVTVRTDEEIDAMFWISKTSRNLLKRDATKLRQAEPKGTAAK